MGWMLGLGLGAFACTSDTTPVIYVDLSYQVRCLDCDPRAPDSAARRIKAVEGELGLKLECRARSIEGTRRVTWLSDHRRQNSDDSYMLSITNLNIEGEESEGPCEVAITEGPNTYKGACGSDDPTPGRPCKVSVDVEDGVVRGEVYCDDIPNEVTNSLTRYLVAPVSREPATFQVYGCRDL